MSLRDTKGFALVLVLWSLASLAALFAHLTAGARSASGQAHDLLQHFQQEQAAEAAVHIAAFHLLDHSSQHWANDGEMHLVTVGSLRVAVRIRDEADKINLNTASVDLLRELLEVLKIAPADAAHLAEDIVEWRGTDPQGPDAAAKLRHYRLAGLHYQPPEQPFRSLDELGLVLGMTPELLARAAPHLTLYSTYGPGASTSDEVVFKALMRVRQAAGVLPLDRADKVVAVVRIEAATTDGNGAAVTRDAVLKLDAQSKERRVRILEWQ